jgi:hypothetical protein
VKVELASLGDFIPELPGWRDRRDIEDVLQMHARGLIEPRRLLELFAAIEPQLYRYPAIDPRSFRAAVQEMAERMTKSG